MAGCYKLAGNIVGSVLGGDCIVIEASNVNLDANGFDVIGGGNVFGAGIHVLAHTPSGAAVSAVSILGEANVASHVENFGTGILVDATIVSINFMILQNNMEDGIKLTNGSNTLGYNLSLGNFGNGITLVNSNGNSIGFNAAEDNAGTGISLTHSSGNSIGQTTVAGNGVDGIDLFATSNNNRFVGDFDGPNTRYNVWVMSSSANQIVSIFFSDNAATTADIYLGCSANFPAVATCTPQANSNRIDSNFLGINASYGIAVDKASAGNTIFSNFPGPNSVFTLFDGNTKCGTNTWFGNSFATANLPCIH